MAEQIGGFTDVEALFYSRKNFKRPDLQVSKLKFTKNEFFAEIPFSIVKVSPHRGFEEEVALLDSFFDDGRAYCLGSVSIFFGDIFALNYFMNEIII